MPICAICGADKPTEEFYLRKETGRRRSQCKTCWRTRTDAWAAANPDRRKAIANLSAHNNLEWQRDWKRRNYDKSKAWDRANPAAVRSMKNAWKRRNPHKILADVRVRQAAKLRAMPSWADRAAIDAIYAKARELGLEVDHQVPLRHPLVCGLHVEANLRPVTQEVNRAKGNRSWPDMPT